MELLIICKMKEENKKMRAGWFFLSFFVGSVVGSVVQNFPLKPA